MKENIANYASIFAKHAAQPRPCGVLYILFSGLSNAMYSGAPQELCHIRLCIGLNCKYAAQRPRNLCLKLRRA